MVVQTVILCKIDSSSPALKNVDVVLMLSLKRAALSVGRIVVCTHVLTVGKDLSLGRMLSIELVSSIGNVVSLAASTSNAIEHLVHLATVVSSLVVFKTAGLCISCLTYSGICLILLKVLLH